MRNVVSAVFVLLIAFAVNDGFCALLLIDNASGVEEQTAHDPASVSESRQHSGSPVPVLPSKLVNETGEEEDEKESIFAAFVDNDSRYIACFAISPSSNYCYESLALIGPPPWI